MSTLEKSSCRFEQLLIAHCAPTLANLKPASLFNLGDCAPEELSALLEAWNQKMNPCGIWLSTFRCHKGKALIYVYRKSALEQSFSTPCVKDFLQKLGYQDVSFSRSVEHLKRRFSQLSEFPHEIGVFLGYPLGDVKGFIQNCGQNCSCTGFWKVYENHRETTKLFEKFRRCKRVYTRLFENGKSIMQLTVAA